VRRAGRIGVLILTAYASPAVAQEQPLAETRTVVIGEAYATSHAGQDWLLGAAYRDLWAEPIEVEVLDLGDTGGGLAPLMRIGGLQTRGLALTGQDGRSYTFRSVNKGALLVLPDGFRNTGLETIVQDQVSSALPGGELIAAGLARAAGILHAEPRLVVMPDDPRLGEHREDFAGVVGIFYEFPTAGSFGSTEVFDADELLERRAAGVDRVDSRAFLRARLLDLLIGDWDRHYGQWRWARLPGHSGLQPVPEDRDQAFSNYDGLALAIARAGGGQMVTFGPEYQAIERVAFNGSDFDRLVLTDVGRSEWLDIATELTEQLGDDVIHRAVSLLPPPYYALRGDELERNLRARRDLLVAYADRYYRFLSLQVDVRGTDRDEIFHLQRHPGGDVEVAVSFADQVSGEPHFRRLFDPGETAELRIYLGAGDDRVVVDGEGPRRITLRVIAGPGNKHMADSGDLGIKYYEDPDNDGTIGGLSDTDAIQAFSPMLEANWEIRTPGSPYRDWGKSVQPAFLLRYGLDLGLALGAGIDVKRYGFGKIPWASRHRVTAGYAFKAKAPLISYEAEFRRAGGGPHLEVEATASGVAQLRYYGLGNESPRDPPNLHSGIRQLDLHGGGFVAWGERRNPLFRVGPLFRFVDSSGTNEDTVLVEESPYGVDRFGQLGLQADFSYDSGRSLPALASGFEIDAAARYWPRLWDVDSAYGTLRGTAAGHLQLARPLTVSVFLGGKKAWGDFPYFDAAYLGGEDTFEAYRWNRFAGDAMLRGGTRLRWAFTRLNITVPGDVGVMARADAGRVFLEGEDSDLWHSQLMAGVFYAAFDRLLLVEIAVAWSDEQTVFVFNGDFDWLIR
jgi:hypothetical protein